MSDEQTPIPLVPDGLDYIAKRYGRKIDRSSAYRWFLHGLIATNGHRVLLKTVRVGKFRHVRPGDIDDFFEALSSPTGAPRGGSGRRALQKRIATAIVRSDAP